jgi:hypothetical protein
MNHFFRVASGSGASSSRGRREARSSRSSSPALESLERRESPGGLAPGFVPFGPYPLERGTAESMLITGARRTPLPIMIGVPVPAPTLRHLPVLL